MADHDIDALFGDDFEDDDDDDDFLARELAQELADLNSNALSLDIPDLTGSTASRSTASPSPSAFLGLCLPTPSYSQPHTPGTQYLPIARSPLGPYTNTQVSRSASPPSGTRSGKRKTWEELDNQGAHLPLKKKQNVGTTALSVSPVTAAKTARPAHPVPSREAVARAQQQWHVKALTPRPWPTVSAGSTSQDSFSPRPKGFLASQKDVFGIAGVVGGLDPARRQSSQPSGNSSQSAAGSNPNTPIDLTRELSPAPPAPPLPVLPQLEAHKALATLPSPLLEALYGLVLTPNALPPDLHKLLSSFLYPAPNLFKSTPMPTLEKLMMALKEYLPSKASPPPSTSPLLATPDPPLPRRPPNRPRNVGIGVLPESVRRGSRTSDSGQNGPSRPLPPSPLLLRTTPAVASVDPPPAKKRRLQDLRAELETQRAEIAQSFTKAKVLLRDLQVEESVLVNLKKGLAAADKPMILAYSNIPFGQGDNELGGDGDNELDAFLSMYASKEDGVDPGLLSMKELLGADFNFE